MLLLEGRLLQVAISAGAGSAYLLFGYDQGVLGGLVSQPSFLSAIGNPSSGYLGTIVALFNIGCLGGCVFSAFCGNRLGRKKVITLGCVIMIIGGSLQASTYGAGQLIAGRVISGIGNGMPPNISFVYPYSSGRHEHVHGAGLRFGDFSEFRSWALLSHPDVHRHCEEPEEVTFASRRC